MSTSIIRNTTWVADSAAPQFRWRARVYWQLPLRSPLLASELALFAVCLPIAVLNPGVLHATLVALTCCVLFHLGGLDRSIVASSLKAFLLDTARSITLALLLCGAFFALVPSLRPRDAWALAAVLAAGLVPILLRPALHYLACHRRMLKGVLILGSDTPAGRVCGALLGFLSSFGRNKDEGRAPLRFPAEPVSAAMAVNCKQIQEWIARERISTVIVAERDPGRRSQLAEALLESRMNGLKVYDAVDFYERLSGKIWTETLHPQWLVYTDGFDRSRRTVFLKRFLDVSFAVLLIGSAWPLLLVIWLAIKADSKGPALFRQVRVGFKGRPFVLYKFRSMRSDAEAGLGPVWADQQDGRVTRVGRILRKFRLDEIPQAFNVLKGEMSLVGPRPERPYFVKMLRARIPLYDLRHTVKPGITGWAQVKFPYAASVEDSGEKLQFDLYYAKHLSLKCDLRIMLETLKIVLFGRGR